MKFVLHANLLNFKTGSFRLLRLINISTEMLSSCSYIQNLKISLKSSRFACETDLILSHFSILGVFFCFKINSIPSCGLKVAVLLLEDTSQMKGCSDIHNLRNKMSPGPMATHHCLSFGNISMMLSISLDIASP